MSDKRKDYLSWDEYFMGVAILAGMRSKDPNTQVGACIVSQSNRILSVGYNGFPNGVSDDEFPWTREGEPLKNKYFYSTGRGKDVCDPFPLQRVRESNHTVRDPDGHLRQQQIRGRPGFHCVQAHV